jgi:hypothetical protein
MRELKFQSRPLIIHFAIPWITVKPAFTAEELRPSQVINGVSENKRAGH